MKKSMSVAGASGVNERAKCGAASMNHERSGEYFDGAFSVTPRFPTTNERIK